MDRGAWWATAHDVAELAMTEAAKLTSMLGFLIRSDEFLSLPILLNTHTHTHTHTHTALDTRISNIFSKLVALFP